MMRAKVKCGLCTSWVDVAGHCSQCELRMPSSKGSELLDPSSISGEFSIVSRPSKDQLGRKSQLRIGRQNGFNVCKPIRGKGDRLQYSSEESRASSCPASLRRKLLDASKPPNAHKFRDESPKKISTKIRCISCGCWAARGKHCYHCKTPTPCHPPSAAAAGDAFARTPSGLMSVTSSFNTEDGQSLLNALCLPNETRNIGAPRCLRSLENLELRDSQPSSTPQQHREHANKDLVPPLWLRSPSPPAPQIPFASSPLGRSEVMEAPGYSIIDSPAPASLQIPFAMQQSARQEEVLVPARRQHVQRVSFSGTSTISPHITDSSPPSAMIIRESILGCDAEKHVEKLKFDREVFCSEWEQRLLTSWFDFQLASNVTKVCNLQQHRPRTFVESLHDITLHIDG